MNARILPSRISCAEISRRRPAGSVQLASLAMASVARSGGNMEMARRRCRDRRTSSRRGRDRTTGGPLHRRGLAAVGQLPIVCSGDGGWRLRRPSSAACLSMNWTGVCTPRARSRPKWGGMMSTAGALRWRRSVCSTHRFDRPRCEGGWVCAKCIDEVVGG